MVNLNFSIYHESTMKEGFFRGDGVDRFLKNYDFVCEKPTNEFFVDVG